jgi:hypothetical protein
VCWAMWRHVAAASGTAPEMVKERG